MWPLFVLVALGLGATGCQAVFGVEEYASVTPVADGNGGPGGGDCCVSVTPPDGWDGYYTVRGTTAQDQLATCADQTAPLVLYDGLPDPVTCEACACGAVEGAKCAPPGIECYADDSCEGNANNLTAVLNGPAGECRGRSGSISNYDAYFIDSCKLTGEIQVAKPGSCTPFGGGVETRPGWKNATTLCPSVAGAATCEDDEACVEPAAADGDLLCVRAPGDRACPAGWSLERRAFSSGVDDRACGDCVCGAPAIECSGGFVFYDDENCADAVATVDSPECAAVDMSDASSFVRIAATATSLGCEPSGGAPVGDFVGAGAFTLCCR